MNDGFSGEGNAIFSYKNYDSTDPNFKENIRKNLERDLKIVATNLAFDVYMEKFSSMGGIVEAVKTGLVTEAEVAVSPGMGFGPGGEGFVRFALIENEQRINQAVRNLRKALPKL